MSDTLTKAGKDIMSNNACLCDAQTIHTFD